MSRVGRQGGHSDLRDPQNVLLFETKKRRRLWFLGRLWFLAVVSQGEASCMFQHTCVVSYASISTFAGELPKELGKLVSLKVFSVAGNSIGGGLYVPAYICIFC